MKQFKLFCLFIYLFSSQAFAQRGGSSVEQSTPPSTPLSFFAGYFDTGMLPENRITLDIPLLGLDYGVTDNFTIGTNAASSLLTSVTFQPYLFLKARYRFFSNKKISSVITGYGGYFNLSSHNNNP
ncbi:hypothetical protein [Silvanigrella aquatica]|uniref:Outer membrane protein beta-barrel domain-containing protein n=1 Tax=Silvanigrella aquatica TaxID=1915309 RepID=A0A1L4D1A8_9BACT|nr:hypothetical protein [Silvanigrella aquatica]APJ03977.1 hypothetical protein AXG55_08675 [Silvanigrella aquatica]